MLEAGCSRFDGRGRESSLRFGVQRKARRGKPGGGTWHDLERRECLAAAQLCGTKRPSRRPTRGTYSPTWGLANRPAATASYTVAEDIKPALVRVPRGQIISRQGLQPHSAGRRSLDAPAGPSRYARAGRRRPRRDGCSHMPPPARCPCRGQVVSEAVRVPAAGRGWWCSRARGSGWRWR